MSTLASGLYIVATPIGNLDDITARALHTLAGVDLILAEDTRHSRKLLRHYNINTTVQAYHDHNEQKMLEPLLKKLHAGSAIALISDAGTPLINDPGFLLVARAHEEAIPVIPVPGPSAVICALSASGLPTDRFVYEGFLSQRAIARQKQLAELAHEPRTLVFYEAPHRVCATVQDMVQCFGPERQAVIAKELTKHFETIRQDTLRGLLEWLQADSSRQQGEFVLIIAGLTTDAQDDTEAIRILKILLQSQSVKQAATTAAEILNTNKNRMYDLALAITNDR